MKGSLDKFFVGMSLTLLQKTAKVFFLLLLMPNYPGAKVSWMKFVSTMRP